MTSARTGQLRVLISAGWYGGPGGAQRALHSIIRALPTDDVTVVARRQHPGPLAGVARQPRLFARQHWRWRGSSSTIGRSGVAARLLNPLRRLFSRRYDVYLQLFQGADLNSVVKARVRLLVPSGNEISSAMAAPFDYIALQAPDNERFVPAGHRGVLVPPPVFPPAETSSPVSFDLPDAFDLTVFNPYHAIKGLDDLRSAVDSAVRPIVWCYSNRSLSFDVEPGLLTHPTLIHGVNLSPAEIRYLYEHATAYLCFSRTEGFGWAIADGLRYCPAVVSRRIGVLTYPEARQDGVTLVETWDGSPWGQSASITRGTKRDLSFIAPPMFRQRLLELAGRRGATP